jgi:iron complex transport system substrate-binding protein
MGQHVKPSLGRAKQARFTAAFLTLLSMEFILFHKKGLLTFAPVLMLIVAGCASAAVTQTPTSVPTVAPTTAPTSAPTLAPTSTSTAAPTDAPTATVAPTATTASSIAITDVAGRKVTINGIPQHIISLAPSNTEILFGLGDGRGVVAVDDFSDYPADVKSLPKIGGTSDKYNFEQIVALKPDLILAAGITPPDVLKKLEDLKLTVVVLGIEKTTFDSILTDIALAGQITGRADQAKKVTDSMKQRVDSIKAKVAAAKTKARVYWELDATDPTKPYTVGPGTFVNDIITMAGGVNVFANASTTYPQISAEQVVAMNPEVIILPDAAYGVTVDSVLKRPGWQGIDAVKKKHVYPIDDALVSRPALRVVDGIEAAAKLIHPELFQ